MNKKDIHLDLLRKLEVNPECTQRELSQEMGVSLGKINYCMKKLIEKGWIKLSSFSHSPSKVGYIYYVDFCKDKRPFLDLTESELYYSYFTKLVLNIKHNIKSL